jgi:guanine deaminase
MQVVFLFGLVNKITINKLIMSTTEHSRLIKMAIACSEEAVLNGTGGPFGAVITKGKDVVGKAGNAVMKNNDPTAHAEIMAIRDACTNLKTIDLSGCTIYSSSEPCPMCLAAIYWSKIDNIYYSNTEEDTLTYGFMDRKIFEELKKDKIEREVASIRIEDEQSMHAFEMASKKVI